MSDWPHAPIRFNPWEIKATSFEQVCDLAAQQIWKFRRRENLLHQSEFETWTVQLVV